jgi:hypothetical protein
VSAPQLPCEISPDGGEIWDWASRFSEHIHRQARIRELAADIARSGCGDCKNWMKSRECPKEHNVNGYSRGPSRNAPICSLFVEEPRTAELRQKRRDELARLLGGTPQ